MSGIKYFNLALAFLLEIGLLAIFAYWGYALTNILVLKILLGLCFPVLLGLVWGKYLAPSSKTRLKEPGLIIAKIVIFSLAVLALISTGKHSFAIAFGSISLINLALLYIWRQ